MTAIHPERLRDGRDIAAVLRGRRSRAGRFVVLHARSVEGDGPARLAVVASKKVGGAVSRNRAKRVLREAAGRIDWRDGTDLVLIARPACALHSMWDVHAELGELVAHLGVGTIRGTLEGAA